eukprot:5297540-Prymnesium_polylepis.1
MQASRARRPRASDAPRPLTSTTHSLPRAAALCSACDGHGRQVRGQPLVERSAERSEAAGQRTRLGQEGI